MREAWMDKRQLAHELGISVRTVERLHLPHMRVGGQNRYHMSEVENFLRVGENADNVVQLHPRPGREAA